MKRRETTRQQSRAFVLASLMMCLIAVGIGHGVVWYWQVPHDWQYHTRMRYFQQQQQQQPNVPQVVFFGSSRTQWGVQVPTMEAAYERETTQPVVIHNWGTAGMTLPYFLLVWDRLVRDHIRPDWIIIEVLPATLLNPNSNGNLASSRFPAETLNQADMTLLENDFELWEGKKFEYWATLINPLYSRRLVLLQSRGGQRWIPLAHRVDEAPHLGIRPYFDPTQRPAYAAARQKTYEPLVNKPLAATSTRIALEKLVERIQAANVRVALLIAPEGPDFRQMYPTGKQAELRQYLSTLAQQHQIPLLDAWDWYDSEDPFTDSHHLHPTAADAYSTRFAQQFLKPLLQPD